MSNILRVGALFMQAGTFVPRSLGVETEACSPGWKWITNLDGDSFDRKVRNAGWSFFFLAAKIQVIVLGHWTDKLVGKAVRRVLTRARPAQFNCLEVTELSARRFCGILTFASQPTRDTSRKAQCCPALLSANELTLPPHGLWDKGPQGKVVCLEQERQGGEH